MDKNSIFGLAGLWVLNDTSKVFLPKTDSISIGDNVTLAPSKNALGLTSNVFSGERPCEVSFTCRGLTPLAMSVLAGYDLTANVAAAAPKAHITGLQGNWSAVTTQITPAEVKPGIYQVTKIQNGYSVQLLGKLDKSVLIEAPAPTATLPGVAFGDVAALVNDDYAIVEVYPATDAQGTIKPGTQARPPVRLQAASDSRYNDAQTAMIIVPRFVMGPLPFMLSATTETSFEISGQAEFDSDMEAYFQVSLITPAAA